MLATCEDEADLLDHLERQRAVIENRMRQYRGILGSLEKIIRTEKEARMVRQNATFDVEEKTLDTLLIAGVRMKGRYGDCGKGFARIGRALGRYACGKCFLLHYDHEYKEDDADFEACMPVRKAKAVDGISVRDLPGGRCVALLHRGPYEDLGRSYAKILAYIKGKGYEVVRPTREVYLKGPGMIFKGNPKNYLTEIQMLIAGGSQS
jgi:effector-binding domain-containing protein